MVHAERYCFGVWYGLCSEARLVGLQHQKLAHTWARGVETKLPSRVGTEE